MLLRSLSIGLVALASSFSVTAQSTCSALLDHDQDGIVGVPDLMNLLSFFGGPVNDSPCIEGPPECGGATTVTFDGYTYDLVAIGSQCWFAENLRTTHYANGDSIPGNLTRFEWTSTTTGATTIYGEGSSTVYNGSDDEVANLEAYGRLYNWYAVDDSRSLCPTGWHVSTDGEWTDLTDYLGGSSVAGTEMKSSPEDSPSWNGTNTSGFSALPGGLVYWDGNFSAEGLFGLWWCASSSGSPGTWSRGLYHDNDNVGSGNDDILPVGFSVRCVRDE